MKTTALWTSDRRLYLDAAGNVVEAGDSKRASLLVAEGNTIPYEHAQRLGLTGSEEQTTDEPNQKACTKAPSTKQVAGPEATK